MTLGFVLIFLGAQLALVDAYVLTPRIFNFLSEQGTAMPEPVAEKTPQPYNPFRQVGFPTGQKEEAPVQQIGSVKQKVEPPKWMCWPVLFFGTVVLLHGATMKSD